MSDKETAPCPHVSLKRQNVGNQRWYKCLACPQKFKADEWDGKVAAECTAPAPQPRSGIVINGKGQMGSDSFLDSKATPQVTPELELEKESGGRWLAEFTRFPGVAAYGPSKEEAIRNAAKVLIESEQASQKSRNTGVSLDGGKTIHSKFKND